MQRPAPHFSAPTGQAGYSARPSYQSQFSGSSANQSAQPGKRFIGPDVMFDGKRMRKAVYRKTVDYNTSVVNYLENRIWQRDKRDQRGLQPDLLYCPLVVPPPDLISRPMNCVTSRFIRTSMNKIKCPIFCVCWTPEGRRLITGASSGEFTLWNGLTFNFETILQAHDSSVRAMQWSPNDQWMLTGDHNGFVKYWQSNMNNVKMYQAHKDPIRGLRCVNVENIPSGPPPCVLRTPGGKVCSYKWPSSGRACRSCNLTKFDNLNFHIDNVVTDLGKYLALNYGFIISFQIDNIRKYNSSKLFIQTLVITSKVFDYFLLAFKALILKMHVYRVSVFLIIAKIISNLLEMFYMNVPQKFLDLFENGPVYKTSLFFVRLPVKHVSISLS